jgi:hypothetical protein
MRSPIGRKKNDLYNGCVIGLSDRSGAEKKEHSQRALDAVLKLRRKSWRKRR